jgi:hypothetical protein
MVLNQSGFSTDPWGVKKVKGEELRFSADFFHPLSSERPFKFPRHLVRALEIN